MDISGYFVEGIQIYVLISCKYKGDKFQARGVAITVQESCFNLLAYKVSQLLQPQLHTLLTTILGIKNLSKTVPP